MGKGPATVVLSRDEDTHDGWQLAEELKAVSAAL